MAEAMTRLDASIRERVQAIMDQMGPKMEVTKDVWDEMERQVEQWGEQNHHPAYWLAIAGKQIGQLGAAVLDREWAADPEAGTAKVRHEAMQGAAVLMSLMMCIDRGQMPVGLDTMPQGRQRAKALGIGDEQLNYDEEPKHNHPRGWENCVPTCPAWPDNVAPDPSDDPQRTDV